MKSMMSKQQIKEETFKLIFLMNLENKMKYPDERVKLGIDRAVGSLGCCLTTTYKPANNKTKSDDGLTPKSRYRMKHPEKIKELNKKYYSAEYHRRYRQLRNNNMFVKNNEN